ncbi:MAG: heavy metal-associated domain-containing protein [Chloroflexota bacterium]
MGCPAGVRKALTSLPWVRQVQVNFDTKQAIVTADAARYDEKVMFKALEDGGFGGTLVK